MSRAPLTGLLSEPCSAALCGLPALGCQLALGAELSCRVRLGMTGLGWPGAAGALLLAVCMGKPLFRCVQ